MYRYYYFANTWDCNEPVQVEGYVEALSEEDAIYKLIDDGIIDPKGYEFLELRQMSANVRIKNLQIERVML